MKTLLIVLAGIFYVLAIVASLNRITNGDPSRVSRNERNSPLLSSIFPWNHGIGMILLYSGCISLANNL